MNNKTKNSVKLKAAPAYQNHVRLIGYLGDKPEQYEKATVFSLATKRSWKSVDSGEWQSETEWHRVIAWDKIAAAVATLAKGDHVMVEGDLRSSRYDREVEVIGGGRAIVPMKSWQIRARSVRKLVRKKKNKQAAA